MDRPWRSQADICGTETVLFLGKRRSTGDFNYTLFTGGRFFVSDAELEDFYAKLVEDHVARCVPALNEVRSLKFPMYADFDLETQVETLEAETIHRLAQIATRQVHRFFPEVAAPFSCIVCAKSKGGKAVDPPGTWKHGLHLYWPQLIVLDDQAHYLRASIIVGLEREEWFGHLGVVRPDFDKVVDSNVYRQSGGLRMLGAPKAKKCSRCEKDTCEHCGKRNKGHVIDDNVYVLHSALLPCGTSDDALMLRLRQNVAFLVKSTSLRRPTSERVSSGYVCYAGCPKPDLSHRKRKAGSDDTRRLGVRFNKQEAIVTDKAQMDVIRSHLRKHSAHYEQSHVTVRSDGKSFRAALSGDGARFCLNKKDFHEQQNVFMEVYKGLSSVEYFSRMRCFCRCPVVRCSGKSCAEFKGVNQALTLAEVQVLFPDAGRASTSVTAQCASLGAAIEAQRRALADRP